MRKVSGIMMVMNKASMVERMTIKIEGGSTEMKVVKYDARVDDSQNKWHCSCIAFGTHGYCRHYNYATALLNVAESLTDSELNHDEKEKDVGKFEANSDLAEAMRE